jgi:hypothetical protein
MSRESSPQRRVPVPYHHRRNGLLRLRFFVGGAVDNDVKIAYFVEVSRHVSPESFEQKKKERHDCEKLLSECFCRGGYAGGWFCLRS